MAEQSRPGGGLEEQREAITEVARELWSLLPDGSDRIVCTAIVIGDVAELRTTAIDAAGGEQHVPSTYELVQAVQRVRAIMHAPGTGTWFTGTFILSRPGRIETRFDYEQQPAWLAPPAPESFALDAERFPRDPEHVPGWFAERLG